MDKAKYWVDLAEEDISVSEVLLRSGKVLYSGFMCHLAVEKILKAKIESTLSTEQCEKLIQRAKEMILWIKTLL